jgi:hypothetical protein
MTISAITSVGRDKGQEGQLLALHQRGTDSNEYALNEVYQNILASASLRHTF